LPFPAGDVKSLEDEEEVEVLNDVDKRHHIERPQDIPHYDEGKLKGFD